VNYRIGWTGKLARATASHPWWVLGVWALLLAGAFMLAGQLRTSSNAGVEGTEARRAMALIEAMRGDVELTEEEFIVVEAGPEVRETEFAAFVAALVDDLRALAVVDIATSYLDGADGLLSADGRIALIPVTTTLTESDDFGPGYAILDLVEAADDDPAFAATSVGAISVTATFDELAEETFSRGEMIGLVAAAIITLLVFGAVVASALPIVLALGAVFTAVGVVAAISLGYEVNTFTVIVVTMIGLAVGIDYSLFIVQRFREERDLGFAKLDAIALAGSTASRTVLFSGFAVAIALAGMLIMPDPLFRSFGIGAIVVVATAVAGALTLLPAVLGLLGDRVNRLTLPFVGRRHSSAGARGFWVAVTRAVMARPAISAMLACGVLMVATIPLLGIELGSNGIGVLPADSAPRLAFETINEEFNDGVLTAEVVIVDRDLAQGELDAGLAALGQLLAADGFFGAPEVETNADQGLTRVSIAMKGDFSSEESFAAIHRLRDDYLPAAFDGDRADALVGGRSAAIIDDVAVVHRYLPVIIGTVLTASFLLLLVAFRSIVVPLKAVVMNLLSVGASYGLIVLVFQGGVGNELFGFPQTDVIESWIPLFLFAILFGLSMDYHVFLLSRIKEHYDATGDNAGSVVHGLHSTAAIITGAALIMVAVFGGFALGPLSMFQQMGFGLAVAVILDATVVRMVLVPASMQLLGDRNWYFPAWLEWIPRVSIEGPPVPEASYAGNRPDSARLAPFGAATAE
jgi:RND superfamily putative drug exporter